MYVPLKITTDYSLLKSMITIPRLITFAKEKKISTLSICDTNLFGVMEFYDACQNNHIKPIIGFEVNYNNSVIYLYPKNYRGYQNILKLHTIIETRTLSHLDLELYHHEIKFVIPFKYVELYDEIKEITEEVYIGYFSILEKNNALIKTNKIVYLNDIRALTIEETNYLDYLKMIHSGVTASSFEKENYERNYYMEEKEMEEEDKESTILFANDIEIIIPKENRYIPHFDSTIENSYEYLVALSKKGLMKRLNNNIQPEYLNRLKYELETISKMGFVDYFLIVYDYVFYAKKHDILVGPGRGSAAGSLVSYSLGITDVDPIKYNLMFERFLNPERISMPDIDIDFEYTKRGLVIDYVKSKYGENSVAGIMTFGTLGSKQVLRDVGKILELDVDMINKFVNLINPKLTLKENLENPAIQFYVKNNAEIYNWVSISFKLEGLKRHISTHAAGVVISSVPLDEVIPLCKSGEEILTGVTMNYLEELGLLKMDFLALKNLTIIQNILDLIEKNTHQKINLNAIDLNDKKVLDLFTHADTLGIFQFESTGMTHFLEKLKPTAFEDLVASLALFRPGPMENIDSFIRRKEGKEKIDYIHPDLESILKETYGIIVYQEQIMQILSKIGGFTNAEADMVRRAMSKKKKEVIVESQTKFIQGAIKNGYEESLAEKIYELILKFANYGFNKAHSVSYALIGYQMAYLKVNYPIYFIANLLNMSINAVGKTKEYLVEAKKRNYIIEKPSINFSLGEYRIYQNKLILPFSIIKNLGSESTDYIIEERKKRVYEDFFDFVARTYGKSVNRKTLECLIDAGAFREFGYDTETLKENIDSALNYAKLVENSDPIFVNKPTIRQKAEKEETDERTKEFNTFGFYISNHPSSKFLDKNICKLENMEKNFDKFVKCIVVIENIKIVETKKKEKMAFLKASDETADADFVVFPSLMVLTNILSKNQLVLIEGKVTKRFDKYQINVTNIIKQ